jgi:hypothetical protein
LRAALLGAGPPFAGGLLAVAVLLGWLVGAQGMDEWASARLQGRTSLVFLERFPFRFHRRLEGSLEVLQRLSHEMDRYGYLHPPLVHDRGLGGFAIGEPLPAGAGAVEGAVVRRGQVAVRGWAWLPEADRRADGVLFVVEDPSGVPLPVGLAELHGMLRFVVPAVDHAWDEVRVPGPADFGHWSGSLRTAELPAGDTLSVGAFAVDGRARVLHRLAQELVVRRGAGRLAVEIREAGP